MTDTLAAAVSILFHGTALAMVLYLISVGLSVTMGLMGFVNLAHGVFAMLGGYVVTSLIGRLGVPFVIALGAATVATALASVVVERLLYRRLYSADDLDQVLLTMGLIFMSVAAATYFCGPLAQPMHPPPWLSGPINLGFRSFPAFRSFLILCGAALVTALWLGLERTHFGVRIRAAVDNLRMAQSVGVNTSPVHADFRAGQRIGRAGRRARCRPAGDRTDLRARKSRLFPDRRGGRRARQYPGAVRRRAGDRHRRYRLQVSAARTRRLLYLCPDNGDSAVATEGLVRASGIRPGEFAVGAFARRHRYHPLEALPWLAALAAAIVFPNYLPLGSQILATILFALSADLVLGYAGIVTLGHAAFFGTGAYTAGILAANGWGEPLSGLLAGALAAAVIGVVSGFIVLRTSGLTLLMQTLVVATLLHEAANRHP